MPRYYFPSNDGERRHLDDIGQELAGPAAARLTALDALPDMARETIPDGDHRVMIVEVRDEEEDLIYRATLTLRGEWTKKSPA